MSRPEDDVEIKLALSPQLYEDMRDLATKEKTDQGQVLIRSLYLYKLLHQAHEQGKRIGVLAAEGDTLETEVVGF